MSDQTKLAALLALRSQKNNRHFTRESIAADAVKIMRLGRAAHRNVVNLCNVRGYRAKHDLKEYQIRETANPFLRKYNLHAVVGGEPGGHCLFLRSLSTADGVLTGNTMGGDKDGYGV